MCKKNKNQQVVVAKAATKYSLNVSKTEMYVEKNNEGWYFYYKNASDDGKDNRGVKIDSTKEEFLSAYI